MPLKPVIATFAIASAAALAALLHLGLRDDVQLPATAIPVIAADLTDPVARGAYLALAANCAGCHTARGGEPYAGGRSIDTEFGRFFSPNLTPDRETGLGAWSADEFHRAMHDGRGRHGELLYPVFPYTAYTRLSRADTDALFAYLQSLPPVRRRNTAHALRFPYARRGLLVFWRALYFRAGSFTPDARHDASWNRGAYLVDGLGHCSACHTPRNALGASRDTAQAVGGTALGWYAPALDHPAEAGLAAMTPQDAAALLRSGSAPGAATLGPMAEVVYASLQHLRDEDLAAMVQYLRALPPRERPPQARTPTDPARLRSGAKLYAEHCASCHGEHGEGRDGKAIALAGNRALTMASSVNPIRIVLYGGYAPGTEMHPEPLGMPPFHGRLDDAEIAALLSHVRSSWGNAAAPVQDIEVQRQRSGPLW